MGLRLVRPHEVFDEPVKVVLQFDKFELQLIHLVLHARHLRTEHVFHEARTALHIGNELSVLLALGLAHRALLSLHNFRLRLIQKDVSDVDDAVQRSHDFVAETRSELLGEVVLELAALVLEELGDVVDQEDLVILPVQLDPLHLHFDDLV